MKKVFALAAAAAFALAVSCDKDTVPVPEENGFTAVDLGLSVKWATCNLGASSPEKAGKYYNWADLSGQTWNGKSWSYIGFSQDACPYELDGNGNLKPEYDAAHVALGGSWRMPTDSEMQELMYNCNWQWTYDYNRTGKAGLIISGKGNNKNSIFLPAAGSGVGKYLRGLDEDGYYWTSTGGGLCSDYGRFSSRSFNPGYESVVTGMCIRPVQD